MRPPHNSTFRRPPARALALLSTCALLVFFLTLLFTSGCVRPRHEIVHIPEITLPAARAEHYTLPNGLRVVLQQDRSAPIVAVHIVYHVGSKNEDAGRTGFAHLFEHLMFQGSQHNDRDYFEPLQKLGADFNAGTGQDTTGYHQVVPSNALEKVLWMESDRMGFLLPAMTQKKLDNQRDVVKNEIRQGIHNQPYGMAFIEFSKHLYPPGHPYHWTVAGDLADLDAARMDDVLNFFRKWYNPNNASLCLVGDFDTATAKQLIEKYFGAIPRGPAPRHPRQQPVQLSRPKRVKLYDKVPLTRFYLGFPTVPAHHPDDAPLQILARVMSANQASRLDRALVYEKQITSDIAFEYSAGEIAGHAAIAGTLRPNKSLDEALAVIDAELDRIKKEPPTADEVQRAKNAIEAHFIRQLESALGRASQFNSYNLFRGTPNYAEQDLARFLRVTPSDVSRVARKYFTANRLLMTVEPMEAKPPEK